MTDLVQRLQSERSPLCLEAAREIRRTAAMLREAKAEIIVCAMPSAARCRSPTSARKRWSTCACSSPRATR
jgi:hypothetical protein